MTMMYTVILAICVIMIGALVGMAFTLSVYLADKTETQRAEREWAEAMNRTNR
jgi:predicted transporter